MNLAHVKRNVICPPSRNALFRWKKNNIMDLRGNIHRDLYFVLHETGKHLSESTPAGFWLYFRGCHTNFQIFALFHTLTKKKKMKKNPLPALMHKNLPDALKVYLKVRESRRHNKTSNENATLNFINLFRYFD